MSVAIKSKPTRKAPGTAKRSSRVACIAKLPLKAEPHQLSYQPYSLGQAFSLLKRACGAMRSMASTLLSCPSSVARPWELFAQLTQDARPSRVADRRPQLYGPVSSLPRGRRQAIRTCLGVPLRSLPQKKNRYAVATGACIYNALSARRTTRFRLDGLRRSPPRRGGECCLSLSSHSETTNALTHRG
jgi:hypothetical protein